MKFFCCIMLIFVKKAAPVFFIRAGYICIAFIGNTFKTGPFQSTLFSSAGRFLIDCVTINARCLIWLNSRFASDPGPASLQ